MEVPSGDLRGGGDQGWLTRKTKPEPFPDSSPIRTVDLFSGCGGLSLGIHEACRRMKMGCQVELAWEWDKEAMEVFEENLNPVSTMNDDICDWLVGDLGDPVQPTEMEFLGIHPHAVNPDLLIGGPPCQGHSDLNNHSRRKDPRNLLYLKMVRAAELLEPKVVIIENVSTVIHSMEGVVEKAVRKLEEIGYQVEHSRLKANDFGVPQKRVRHFLIASRVANPDFSSLEKIPERTLRWAIRDLVGLDDPSDIFNSNANYSTENRRRMEYLFAKDIYDLPNKERPLCHRNGHNYPAVYGRMKWDEPTSTITAGFGCTGQGRFVHPDFPRTLTPHEAARVQTFPDWFDFVGLRRMALRKCIGNAVPPLLAVQVAFVALKGIVSESVPEAIEI